MPFPLELITLFGSTLIASLLKVWAIKLENQRALHDMMMERREHDEKAVRSAREHKDKGFQWTRRAIALSGFLSIIVIPKLAVVFGWTDQQITFGWTEWKSGFLFFTEGKEVIRWETVEGIVITPLDTHVVTAILGMYFGSSIIDHTKRRS